MAASPHYRHTQLGWVVLVAMALTAVVVGGLLIAGGLSAAGGITVGVQACEVCYAAIDTDT